jgi:hypothetical protein
MRFLTFAACLLAAACATTSKGAREDGSEPARASGSNTAKSSAKTAPKRGATPTATRPAPVPTEAEKWDFVAVWDLFRRNDPGWPTARDRYRRRSDGAAFVLAAHMLQYYMQVNAARERASRQLVRAKDEVVAVGEPCVGPLVDMMVLDTIPLKDGRKFLVDDVTRQDCVDMLERIGAPAVAPLVTVLERKDASVKARHHAALALGGTREAEAYEPLVRALREDPAWEVRFSAATALGKLRDRRAASPLFTASRDDADASVRKRALQVRRDLLLGKAGR